MRVWLDDIRKPPFGWEWAKTHDECVKLLETGAVVELSLDHDLADVHYIMEARGSYEDSAAEKTGYHVCLWMAEHEVWPLIVRVHSASSVGRERMRATIERYKPAETLLIMMPPGKGPVE